MGWTDDGEMAMVERDELGERRNAHVDAILVNIREPPDHSLVRAGLRPFQDDVRVEEEAQSPISRGLSLVRRTLSPDRRSGDAEKDSARLP